MSMSNGSQLSILMLHPKTLVDSWPFPVDTLGEIIKAPSAVYPILAGSIAHLPVNIEIFDGYVQRETFADYKRRLRRADVIRISMMSPLKALDTETDHTFSRASNPSVKVVLAGHGTVFRR